MGYSKEIYSKALKIKQDKVRAVKNAYDTALNDLRDTNDEFYELETALSKAGSAIALTAFSGDTQRLSELKEFCLVRNARKQEILDAAGIKKPDFLCKKCEDSGYSSGGMCSCVTDIAKKLAYEELSKSLPLEDCSLENFDLRYYSEEADSEGAVPRKRATAILNLCRRFVDGFSPDTRSLLFMGGAGLGKTHLSLALVRTISEKGYGVVYGSAQNLFSAAEKEHFSFSGETTAEESLINCDLLVIDDLGTEFYSSYTSTLFYNIINSRILNKKPTIINTNLTFDELEKRYTPRITSRFIGNYEMREFIGSDIRQQKLLEG